MCEIREIRVNRDESACARCVARVWVCGACFWCCFYALCAFVCFEGVRVVKYVLCCEVKFFTRECVRAKQCVCVCICVRSEFAMLF